MHGVVFGNELLKAYEVFDEIGRGATGIVFRARSLKDGSDVAIKILKSSLSSQSDIARRMKREWKILHECSHPNLVRVLEFGDEDNGCYLVQEFLEGQPLEDYLEDREKISVSEAKHIAKQIASALAYTHERGVIHRDLKPDNIIVQGGKNIKVLDFGFAHTIDATTALTKTGAFIGTPLYMAPEQLLGEGVTDKADTYALGTVLYRALVGSLPFGDNLAGLMRKTKSAAPSLKGKTEADLAGLIDEMLAIAPGSRLSMSEVLAKLESKKTEAPTRTKKPRLKRKKRLETVGRWRALLITGAMIAAVLLLLLLCRPQSSIETRANHNSLKLDKFSIRSLTATSMSLEFESSLPCNARLTLVDDMTGEKYDRTMRGDGPSWHEEFTPLSAGHRHELRIELEKDGKFFKSAPKMMTTSAVRKRVLYDCGSQLLSILMDRGGIDVFIEQKHTMSSGFLVKSELYAAFPQFGVVALDVQTRKTLWNNSKLMGVKSIRKCFDDIVTLDVDNVCSLSRKTGVVNWAKHFSVGLDKLFYIWNENVFVYARDGTVNCLERKYGSVVWQRKHLPSEALKGWTVGESALITKSRTHLAHAFDVRTGKPIAGFPQELPQGHTISPIEASGKIFWAFNDGRITIGTLGAAPSMTIFFGGQAGALAYETGRLFVGTWKPGDVMAFDAKTGNLLWSKKLDRQVNPKVGMHIANNRLYLADENFSVYCFHTISGRLLWKVKTDMFDDFPLSPVDNGLIYCSNNWNVVLIEGM